MLCRTNNRFGQSRVNGLCVPGAITLPGHLIVRSRPIFGLTSIHVVDPAPLAVARTSGELQALAVGITGGLVVSVPYPAV